MYAERLFTANGTIPTDEAGRIRIDDWEMREDVQSEVGKLWGESTTENLSEIGDLAGYTTEFYHLFGFGFEGVNYEAEVDEMVEIENLV